MCERHRDGADDGEVVGPRRGHQSTTSAVDGHRQSAGEDAYERVTGAQGRTRSATATDQPFSVSAHLTFFALLLELISLYYNGDQTQMLYIKTRSRHVMVHKTEI